MTPESPGIEGLERALERGGGWSVLKMTPAHVEMLTAGRVAGELAGKAKTVVIGGEDLRPELEKAEEQAPGTRVINEYGPTETVVGCSVHEVSEGDEKEERVSIGRPIGGARVYVMDERQRVWDRYKGRVVHRRIGSGEGIRGMRSRRLRGWSLTRTEWRAGRGCTVPEITGGGRRTGSWSAWDEWTGR